MPAPPPIKPEDVTWFESSAASDPPSGPHSSRARQSRSARITFRHIPTGVEVSGQAPESSYTRKAMADAKARLRDELMAELVRAVANHLRLPGR